MTRLYTPAKQPESETVTHLPQPPVTDIELFETRVDCSNNELAAECLHTPNDWQNEWTRRFNIVTDSATLEETLTEFIAEAKTIHQKTLAPHTQTRGEPPRRLQRQFHHRQRMQGKRQEN